jgi:hypothetical protein
MHTDAIIKVSVTPGMASNLKINLMAYLIVCHLISTSIPLIYLTITTHFCYFDTEITSDTIELYCLMRLYSTYYFILKSTN